ncbi:MAG: diaminopimelate epimerase [Candidatus Omnitrophota bacterium]
MAKILFTKMVGAGNDFIVIDNRSKKASIKKSILSSFAKSVCERKTSIGADGILVLEASKRSDFKMRIFNADGTEAEMCGNGLRCAAKYVYNNAKSAKKTLKVEAIAGLYVAEITSKDNVKIKMEDPKDKRLGLQLKINTRAIRVSYINTGVPHTVIFVHGLDDIDIDPIGRTIRYHDQFKPRGTNVDFVEIKDEKNIRMRTYERGVEGETLACGTGAVASAVIAGHRIQVTSHKSQDTRHKINVHTKGGVLKISFKKVGSNIKDVYLEGEAKEVFKGEVDHV